MPLDVPEDRMAKGVKGTLGGVCTIRVIYGVTEEEFKLQQLTLGEVEEKCRNWSEKVSQGKTNTTTKLETSTIVKLLKVYKNLAKQSNTYRNVNASASYGRDGTNGIQNSIPTKANSKWPQCIALNLEVLKTAIHDPTLKNMCTLQSKLATKNKSEVGIPVKPLNFLDWKNMATDTKMSKAVNKGRNEKRPGKEGTIL